MKKIAVFFVFVALFLGWLFFNKDKNIFEENGINSVINNTSSQKQNSKNFIFVPYWSFSDNLSDISIDDNLFYFGISINDDGIDKNDEGFKKLGEFSRLAVGDKRYLVVRIFREDNSGKILNDAEFQSKVAREISTLAKEYGFYGVVIDYETSAFGFQSTQDKITRMYEVINEDLEKSDLEFFVTFFGDTYYRGRPYDVKAISILADGVVVMAYDFHKVRLNPGPNFPFSDKQKYGYDFQTMIKDFRKDVDFEKIIITMGYFGYDWKMENGTSVEMAEPLSLNQVRSRFIDSCDFTNCRVDVNKDSERVIYYTDGEGYAHEVWSEDEASAKVKIDYLNSIGINQIASWAYSYY